MQRFNIPTEAHVQRLLSFVAALVWLATPALAQDPSPSQARRADTSPSVRTEVERSQTLPPEPIPTRYLRGYDWYQDDLGDLGSPSDTLSEAQISMTRITATSRVLWGLSLGIA